MRRLFVMIVLGGLVAAAAAAGPPISRFLDQDACLDAGGRWDAAAGLCEYTHPGAVDRLLLDKSERRLTLYSKGRRVHSYDVALGRGGLGAKRREGDGKVPEGVYRIAGRKADSAYHRALRIGYPTPAQRQTARARGEEPGGDIMIHGIRNGMGWIGSLHRVADWTQGCIAVTDREIEEIWRMVPDGAVIEIRP